MRCARVSSVCAKEMTIRSRRRTNPKLHPYMFRVCDSKTPFFFLCCSISRRFPLSLSLSKINARASWCFHNTESAPGFVRRREKDIYIYIYIRSICFSLPFFFTFSFFLCARVQRCVFESIRFIERDTCREYYYFF